MALNIGPFRQILELEFKKGYPDSAVIGGIDRFLNKWSSQFQGSISDPKLLKRLSMICPPVPGYASMTKPQRKEWAKNILDLIDEIENPVVVKPAAKRASGIVEKIDKKAITSRNTKPVPPAIGKTIGKPSLDASATMVKGISGVLVKRFEKLGVQSVHDLLYFFPHRHLDYSKRAFINNLAIGAENTIIANVWEAREVQLGTRKSAEATVGDETGNVRIVWFNQPYMAKSLKTGEKIVVSGKVTLFNGMLQFESPEWEPYEDKDLIHTGRLVPVYPLTQGLSQRQVRRILKPAIDQWVWQLDEFLPSEIAKRQCN